MLAHTVNVIDIAGTTSQKTAYSCSSNNNLPVLSTGQ